MSDFDAASGMSTYHLDDMAFVVAVDRWGNVTVHQNCPDGYMIYSLKELATQKEIVAAGGTIPEKEVKLWQADDN